MTGRMRSVAVELYHSSRVYVVQCRRKRENFRQPPFASVRTAAVVVSTQHCSSSELMPFAAEYSTPTNNPVRVRYSIVALRISLDARQRLLVQLATSMSAEHVGDCFEEQSCGRFGMFTLFTLPIAPDLCIKNFLTDGFFAVTILHSVLQLQGRCSISRQCGGHWRWPCGGRRRCHVRKSIVT